MRTTSELEVRLKPRDHGFQAKTEEENTHASHLFCTKCGGYKPHCRCNSFTSQMELIYQK